MACSGCGATRPDDPDHRAFANRSGNHGCDTWLLNQGEKKDDIGARAGITDASQIMALDAKLIRADKLAPSARIRGQRRERQLDASLGGLRQEGSGAEDRGCSETD